MAQHRLSARYPDSWPRLLAARERLRRYPLRDLFANDSQRGRRFALQADDLYLDYSKQHLDDDALAGLIAWGEEAGLLAAMARQQQGAPVNNTEQRPALHTALRDFAETTPQAREAAAVREQLAQLVKQLHSGQWRGFDGDPIRHVVNLGIGGSDLGPRLVVSALADQPSGPLHCHFVANLDPDALNDTLADLKPGETLFLVTSKSFTTLETLTNARRARDWLQAAGCPETDLARHFLAVTARLDRAQGFGISPANCFPLWDWVGGRFSLWSAVGLPIALRYGWALFDELLRGAERIDRHARQAPLARNLPALLALLDQWYNQFWQASSQVVLPYSHRLRLLPDHLQQLSMESLGKGVDRDGQPVDYPTGQILWGQAGTVGQHSFHQLLHQGSHLIPAEFLAVAGKDDPAHPDLLANCLAQSQVLLDGRQEGEPHQIQPGNRPSSTLLLPDLSPRTLGALLALYEHRTAFQAQLLAINAFDQWGVEQGKVIGHSLSARLAADDDLFGEVDSSTAALVEQLRRWR